MNFRETIKTYYDMAIAETSYICVYFQPTGPDGLPHPDPKIFFSIGCMWYMIVSLSTETKFAMLRPDLLNVLRVQLRNPLLPEDPRARLHGCDGLDNNKSSAEATVQCSRHPDTHPTHTNVHSHRNPVLFPDGHLGASVQHQLRRLHYSLVSGD